MFSTSRVNVINASFLLIAFKIELKSLMLSCQIEKFPHHNAIKLLIIWLRENVLKLFMKILLTMDGSEAPRATPKILFFKIILP